MTNPTLERAARAAREYMESVNADEHTADVLTLGVARAVLMAVREPDEAEKAGAFWLAEFQTPGSDTHLRAVAGNIFTAMIDAILAEGE